MGGYMEQFPEVPNLEDEDGRWIYPQEFSCQIWYDGVKRTQVDAIIAFDQNIIEESCWGPLERISPVIVCEQVGMAVGGGNYYTAHAVVDRPQETPVLERLYRKLKR